MRTRRWALVAILAGIAGVAQAQREAKGTKLRAQCISAVDQTAETTGSIAEIVVENRGNTPLEPMAFRVQAKPERKGSEPEQAECVRADAPWAGRGGRPVRPGGRESYFVLSPFSAARTRRASVEVSFECASPPECEVRDPVEVLGAKVGSIHFASQGRELPQTVVELSNRVPFDLDATFRATFDAPFERVSLLRVRLAAGERRSWRIDEVPLHEGALDGAGVKRLELVDWCVLRTAAGDAREMLGAVLARWKRSPARVAELASRCRVKLAAPDLDAEAVGRARVLNNGTPDLEIDFEPFGDEAERVARTIELPFLLMRPQGLEEELASRTVDAVIADKDRVLVLDPPIRIGEITIGALAFDEGRFLWHSEDPAMTPGARRVVWRTRLEGDGWVLEGLDVFRAGQQAPLVLHRFAYEDAGEARVPVRYTRKLREEVPPRSEDLEISFERWESADDARAPAPTGAAAEALRAAWDAPYRYPDDEVVVRGNFEARTTRRGDPQWCGLEGYTGSFVLEGFRRGRWREARIEVKSHVLDPDQRAALADLLEARLRSWFRGDFAGRRPFDEAFAGARISGADPRFEVAGGDVVTVVLDEGLPAQLGLSGGEVRAIRYQAVDRASVPVGHATSSRTLRAELGAISPQWRFPRRIEIRDSEGEIDTLLLRAVAVDS